LEIGVADEEREMLAFEKVVEMEAAAVAVVDHFELDYCDLDGWINF